MFDRIARRTRDQRGVSAVEYGLVMAAIVVGFALTAKFYGMLLSYLFLGTCAHAQGSAC